MSYSSQELWERFQKYYYYYPNIDLALDLSRMDLVDDFFEKMSPHAQRAFAEMEALEAGAIANPDENRMVGHYWLRNPSLAPSTAIREQIESAIDQVRTFAADIHSGRVQGQGGIFKNYLLIGIGGSALGPQFLAHALGNPRDRMKPFFLDNTDPNGMWRVLQTIYTELNQTLCIVISKSGATKETRNGMLEAKAAFARAGLDFGKHAVAITQKNSQLDNLAVEESWIARFPMWDWVGGRTSETSVVGMLPAALQGFEFVECLTGAKLCDEVTRAKSVRRNPAMLMALAWFSAVEGTGKKNMVVIPYRDRLELLSKYLQQLIMESLGKELDRSGKPVYQGITVMGNKGATDQHSYIQQIRDGVKNSFVVFIEVLEDGIKSKVNVESGFTSGDYLNGFYLGTRQALYENGRLSLTITIRNVTATSIGALIAIFERAVGYYAALTNINAYHQPGVEAGKKAAGSILILQRNILDFLGSTNGDRFTCQQIAKAIKRESETEHIYKICNHLESNDIISIHRSQNQTPATDQFYYVGK